MLTPPHFSHFLHPFTFSPTVDDSKLQSALKNAVDKVIDEEELGISRSGGLHKKAFKMALQAHARNLGTHGRQHLRRRIAAWVHSIMAHAVTPSTRMHIPGQSLRGWSATRLSTLEDWVLANLCLDRSIELRPSTLDCDERMYAQSKTEWFDGGHVVWATEWEEVNPLSNGAFRTHAVQSLLQWKKEHHSGCKPGVVFPRQKELEACALYPSGSTPVSKDDVKAISECLIKAALAFKPTKKGEWSKRDITPVVREYLQVDNMRLHAPNACPYRRRRWKPWWMTCAQVVSARP